MTSSAVTAALVAVDVAWIVGFSVAVGAWAPRWPDAWLARDRFPVCRWPGESVELYRRLGVRRLADHLPDGGTVFGGSSKSRLGGHGPLALQGYLREVRRAEWVHLWSIAGSFVLFAINPWWFALALVLAVCAGNLPCLLVLRNNRLRITRVLARRGDAA